VNQTISPVAAFNAHVIPDFAVAIASKIQPNLSVHALTSKGA
jgi:hypothetical protein